MRGHELVECGADLRDTGGVGLPRLHGCLVGLDRGLAGDRRQSSRPSPLSGSDSNARILPWRLTCFPSTDLGYTRGVLREIARNSHPLSGFTGRNQGDNCGIFFARIRMALIPLAMVTTTVLASHTCSRVLIQIQTHARVCVEENTGERLEEIFSYN
jgi:hypothetical protein